MLAVEKGFCNRLPLKRPKFCRWCGERMKFIKARVVACPDCDQTGWWDDGGHG